MTLIVDEVGYVPLDALVSHFVFSLICRRYEKGATTQGVPPEEGVAQLLWNDPLASGPLREALAAAFLPSQAE